MGDVPVNHVMPDEGKRGRKPYTTDGWSMTEGVGLKGIGVFNA